MSSRFRHGRGPRGTARGRAVTTVVGRSRREKLKRLRFGGPRVMAPRPGSINALELKGMDTAINLTSSNVLSTTNTNGATFVLNLVQTGNGSWNRVGRKISMKNVRIRGTAAATLDDNGGASPQQALTLRMVLVYDSQPSSGTIPTFDTIFGNTAQDGTESTTIISPLRYDNTGRFRVIRDWVRTFAASSVSTTLNSGNQYIYFDEFVDLKGAETIFSGQSAPMTIADISSGALYLIFRADANTGASAQAQILTASFARLRYID